MGQEVVVVVVRDNGQYMIAYDDPRIDSLNILSSNKYSFEYSIGEC